VTDKITIDRQTFDAMLKALEAEVANCKYCIAELEDRGGCPGPHREMRKFISRVREQS
jgi:hypothetical protein